MVLSSWQRHCNGSWLCLARVHPVYLMNVERHQVAADPRPSQTTWAVSLPVHKSQGQRSLYLNEANTKL